MLVTIFRLVADCGRKRQDGRVQSKRTRHLLWRERATADVHVRDVVREGRLPY